MKYKVGDRVRVVSKRTFNMNIDGGMDKYLGRVVTIVGFHPDGDYQIAEDRGEYCGCGWSWQDDMFDGLVDENRSIHITSDGRTTHAILKDGKRIIKRSKATCAPNDEFDIIKGAMLALSRLI